MVINSFLITQQDITLTLFRILVFSKLGESRAFSFCFSSSFDHQLLTFLVCTFYHCLHFPQRSIVKSNAILTLNHQLSFKEINRVPFIFPHTVIICSSLHSFPQAQGLDYSMGTEVSVCILSLFIVIIADLASSTMSSY